MTLPVSGSISLSQVAVELGRASNATTSLGESAVRTLFGIASGAIDMNTGHGKSNRTALSVVLSSNVANTSVNITSLSGYVAGKTDLTITVNSGVYVYSTTTSPALTIGAGNSGDTVKLVNNGYIMGLGGDGVGIGWDGNAYYYIAGGAGNAAISTSWPLTVDSNSGYIGGGGGGGGAGLNSVSGGGGAGGGSGGMVQVQNNPTLSGGAGGSIGNAGGTGTNYASNSLQQTAGGGGRIMPGVGGAAISVASNDSYFPGNGGGAGGGGSMSYFNLYGLLVYLGGGGGGWGAAGGSGSATHTNGGAQASGAGGSGGSAGGNGAVANITGSGFSNFSAGLPGGKAINTNGNTITYIGSSSSRVYGAVS